MLKLKTPHFLTGEELSYSELIDVLDLGNQLRHERSDQILRDDLKGMTLVTVFDKPSLRTHLSFSIAMTELGGAVVNTFNSNRKHEEPEDVARVLSGYAHAVAVRTFDQKILERMASVSKIPVINALSDSHHPCQTLADLLTIKQKFGKFEGIKLTYIGDGNNALQSLMLLCPFLGIELRYATPKGFEPNAFVVKSARARAKKGGGSITAFATPAQAAQGAHVLYTDVWTSMGQEKELQTREMAFDGFQVNRELYAQAAPEALIMHLMPMVRGQEITDEMADHKNSVIFQQSENRLHAQKALLLAMLGRSWPN